MNTLKHVLADAILRCVSLLTAILLHLGWILTFFRIMDGDPLHIGLSASPKNVMTGFSQACDPTPSCQILTFPSFLGTKNGPKTQLWSMTLKGKSAGSDFL